MYGVKAPIDRDYRGSQGPIFHGESVKATTHEASLLLFEGSVEQVRSHSSESGSDPSEMRDPKTLPAGSPFRQALEKLYRQMLSTTTAPRFPGGELAEPLIETAKEAEARGAACNAVALVDPFGNLLACRGGSENRSPIRTAFLQLTRDYAKMRWQLINDPGTRAGASECLTHPKHCTFVSL